jgi:hypothetical protein
MAGDPDRPMETARKRAARKWANNALRKRYKEGTMPIVAVVDPDTIDWDNEKIHLKKEAPPQPADVVKNDDPKANKFESKFIKDIRAMMEAHKLRNVELQLALIAEEKRKLLKEKLRRLEASIAEREGAKP